MMRVGIILPNFGGGGAEFVAAQWARFLTSNGHDVKVYLTHPRPEDLATDIATVSVAGNWPLAHVRNLRAQLRAHAPDVVLSLMPYFNLINLLACLRLRASHTPAVVISGRNVDTPFRQLFGLKFRIMQAGARILYRRAHAFVAISHPVAAEAIAAYKVPLERIHVVLNPALGKLEERKPRSPRRHGSPGDRLSIVVPARIVPQKRPELAVRAAAILLQQGRRVELVYFGAGSSSEQVLALADELKVPVDMRGWVSRWFDECPSGSVVLLPSVAEGFGNVLVEAAAVGIPSVASSRCLGAADAIVPGLTGELCVGDSAEDYAAAIDRASRITVRADEWLKHFSARSSGESLLRALESARELAR
jgi:glycosyltransferase involved in cell wall biosynthesis